MRARERSCEASGRCWKTRAAGVFTMRSARFGRRFTVTAIRASSRRSRARRRRSITRRCSARPIRRRKSSPSGFARSPVWIAHSLPSDGASAVEAAIKMALQYWQNVGQPQRTRFVRLSDAYHGDTIGAMSVSDIALFKSRFGSVDVRDARLTTTARALGRRRCGGDRRAARPSGGRHAARSDRESMARCATSKPLIIVDEIATGFGRTGTMFAFEQIGVEPGHRLRRQRA